MWHKGGLLDAWWWAHSVLITFWVMTPILRQKIQETLSQPKPGFSNICAFTKKVHIVLHNSTCWAIRRSCHVELENSFFVSNNIMNDHKQYFFAQAVQYRILQPCSNLFPVHIVLINNFGRRKSRCKLFVKIFGSNQFQLADINISQKYSPCQQRSHMLIIRWHDLSMRTLTHCWKWIPDVQPQPVLDMAVLLAAWLLQQSASLRQKQGVSLGEHTRKIQTTW